MANLDLRLPEEVRTFELPCTGRVNEVMLMQTLQDGVAGVIVVGCHNGNCKHLDGNLRAQKRVARVEKLLNDAGIRDKLVGIHFTAPDEGKKLYETLHKYYEMTKEKK
jgi:F420-non-reducing hydrogenase iron-sulfur subunit